MATSLTDGRMQWFSEGPAAERIQASAALPALLPPVAIDGEAFIDGGVVDNVPIGRAIAQGAERIFVLLCGPLRYTPHRYRRPIEGVLTAFFIAVHAKFARELEHLPDGVEVIVLTVDTEPVSRYDDFSATDALISAGRANANIVLDFWESGGIGDTFGPRPASTNRPTRPVRRDDTSGRGGLRSPRRRPAALGSAVAVPRSSEGARANRPTTPCGARRTHIRPGRRRAGPGWPPPGNARPCRRARSSA